MPIHAIPKIFLTRSRQLRKRQTPWERKLWSSLRVRKIFREKFRRQYVIGPYIVDFCCPAKRLVIELDGGQHNESNHIQKDKNRDKFLRKEGYIILRFWNTDINQNLEGVSEKINQALNN